MTKVALMQPAFLPWQGLFELIYKSDEFVFLDDFQFSCQSHHTRNKLFVNKNQVDYYNVPIQKSKCFELKLNEVLIIEGNHWKNKILKRLQNVYAKSEFYKDIYPFIESWLLKDYKNLAELNIEGIKMFCKVLGIRCRFLYSSVFTKKTKSKSTRSKRVEEILDWTNADLYLSAFGSFDYMKEDGYDYNKYPVIFQNYIPKPYKQVHSEEFIPYLSLLDALFNIGSTQTIELIKSGTTKWLSWENMDKLIN